MRRTWDIVIRLRPTIFVALITFLVFSLPSQILELYLINIETLLDRSIGQDNGGNSTFLTVVTTARPIVLSMVFGILAILILWLASVRLLALGGQREAWSRWQAILADGLVVLIAVSPIVGVLSGLYNARDEIPRIGQGDLAELKAAVAAYIWATRALLVLLTATILLANAFIRARIIRLADKLFSPLSVTIGVLTVLLFATGIAFWPTSVSSLGTQALIFLFVAALAFVLTFFSQTYQKTGFPITVMVVAAAVLFSVFGWNDNHKVDYTDGGKLISLENAFSQWYKQRGDLDYYVEKGKPYPVYIVAAEGGGMYAAYHAAAFLARIQGTCRNFAQHVFAISSVSGGSLGAAVFAAQVNKSVENRSWQQPCGQLAKQDEVAAGTRNFFRYDFLAPLVAATLFPDVLQRLIPYPIRQFDRARALEQAFVEAEDENGDVSPSNNAFELGIVKLWGPDRATPALVLNTSSVETGQRIALSPFKIGPTPSAWDVSDVICGKDKAVDIQLATAVSLSARFPWLTPSGWLERTKDCRGKSVDPRKPNRLYLVDGGYFENSGLETTIEIVKRLRAFVSTCRKEVEQSSQAPNNCKAFLHDIEFRTIMIFTMDDFAVKFTRTDGDLSSSTSGELYTPLKTMLNTRRARTRAINLRQTDFNDDFKHLGWLTWFEGPPDLIRKGMAVLRRYFIPKAPFLGVDDLHHVMLDGTRFFLPLGWRLSERSMLNIERSMLDNEENKGTPSIFALKLIRSELMGEDTETLKRPTDVQ